MPIFTAIVTAIAGAIGAGAFFVGAATLPLEAVEETARVQANTNQKDSNDRI